MNAITPSLLTLSEQIAFVKKGEIKITKTVILHAPYEEQWALLNPLKQQFINANASLTDAFTAIPITKTKDNRAPFKPLNGPRLQRLMLHSNLDVMQALQHFKNTVVALQCVHYMEDCPMSQKHWQNLNDTIKAEIFFAYIATFLFPRIILKKE